MRKELCRGICQNIQKQDELPQNLAKYKNNSLKRLGWTDLKQDSETDCNCYFCENLLAQQVFKVHFSCSLKRFRIP